jgi:exonuclease SbcD
MRLSFAHLADVHLGNMQYGLNERFDDFGNAWLDTVKQIISSNVDFVVIAGDLFDKRSIEPVALMQAQKGLRLLRDAGIPAIAVEGNHDRALYREGFSWMEYLDTQEELKLLSPYSTHHSGCQYRPHRPGRGGSYIDVAGARIVGQPYLGASAARALEEMAAHLRLTGQGEAQYLVYVCHAGVEGKVPHAAGCLTEAELAHVRPHVDYMAMGHIHKPFQHERWLFNPGALETCRSDEADEQSGFFLVDVDTESDLKHQVSLRRNWRRPFHRLSYAVDGISGPEVLHTALNDYLCAQAAIFQDADAPIIELKLMGLLDFGPKRLDLAAIKEWVWAAFSPLHAEIKDLSRRPDEVVSIDETMTRSEMERRVLTELFGRDARYAASAEDWSRLATTLKEMTLANCSPAQLIDALTQGADALGALPPEAVMEGISSNEEDMAHASA